MAKLTETFLCVLVALSPTLRKIQADLNATIPFPATVLSGTYTDQVCPSQEDTNDALDRIEADVRTLLRDAYELDTPCGASGWVRVAFLNMSNPSENCPSAWELYTTPQRACGQGGGPGCDGVTYSSDGLTYSEVCGRVLAFPRSTVQAFRGGTRSIDTYYVDGVSVTHGSPRQHIWSFAAGNAAFKCLCDGGDETVPPFVGDHYFCEGSQEGNPPVDTDVILWDGEDCLPDSECCSFNSRGPHSPLVFRAELPATTSDDIEVRICSRTTSLGGFNTEDTPIFLMEIYVK